MTREAARVERESRLLDLDVTDDSTLHSHGKVGARAQLGEVRLAVKDGLIAAEVSHRRDEVLDRSAQGLFGLAGARQFCRDLDAVVGDKLGDLRIEPEVFLSQSDDAEGSDPRMSEVRITVGS